MGCEARGVDHVGESVRPVGRRAGHQQSSCFGVGTIEEPEEICSASPYWTVRGLMYGNAPQPCSLILPPYPVCSRARRSGTSVSMESRAHTPYLRIRPNLCMLSTSSRSNGSTASYYGVRNVDVVCGPVHHLVTTFEVHWSSWFTRWRLRGWIERSQA